MLLKRHNNTGYTDYVRFASRQNQILLDFGWMMIDDSTVHSTYSLQGTSARPAMDRCEHHWAFRRIGSNSFAKFWLLSQL
jgi:hypothetical protein